MKIYLETMGCQMNRLDSELVEGLLRAAGHEILLARRDADVVLYNTCSVRDRAEEKVHSRLGAEAHHADPDKRVFIGVLGCMAQRLGKKLLARHKNLSFVCSPGRLRDLPALLESALAGHRPLALDPGRSQSSSSSSPDGLVTSVTGSLPHPETPDEWDSLDLSRPTDLVPGNSQSYVRITRGCDKFCTYCIVPFVRGPEVSRDPGRIADEVRRLVDAGRSEITLLGQTVNSYLWSTTGRTVRFSDLLSLLSPTPGLRRLRFVTSHPLNFGDDVLTAMRDAPNVCRYIHCPAQSGSDAILKRMNRQYTRAQYDDLIDRAYAILPDVALAGDFIVGFPGETDADHAASVDLIRRTRYKNSFIFKYSPRAGTLAAKRLADDIPEPVKKRRNADLLAAQGQVGLVHHRSYVGRRVEVLVSGLAARPDRQQASPAPGQVQLLGRTRGDHIVVFNAPESLIGTYADVSIVHATDLTLFGTFP
ncbi:MAG: MiaB/RimO family radical SAM methylthiotransferase [Planctomycetota bacterium]|nr:MiaB/RimO family radical SAM methylthiotransferase [Planctomycetota bacterium]